MSRRPRGEEIARVDPRPMLDAALLCAAEHLVAEMRRVATVRRVLLKALAKIGADDDPDNRARVRAALDGLVEFDSIATAGFIDRDARRRRH